MTTDGSALNDRLRHKTPTWKKLLLSLGTLLVAFLVLESAARIYMPYDGPVRVRDGFYQNSWPLITAVGGPQVDFKDLPGGERLPVEKEDGELRVFVYGESSVAGSPFDVRLSFPAMLYDRLREDHPDRKITVVNLGRPGSVAANIYYYQIAVDRYKPDFAVYYMGMNDADLMPGESCMLSESPVLYGLWRALVSRSSLLWLARVYGSQILMGPVRKEDPYPIRDCSKPSFQLWTDLLLESSIESGAQVVVANPVYSAAGVLETEAGVLEGVPELSDDYKELLKCSLQAECDERALFLDKLETPAPAKYRDRGDTYIDLFESDLGLRSNSWGRSVEKYGGEHIEFDRILKSVSKRNLLVGEYFGDWLRLSPPGYYFLARLTAERIRRGISGEAPRPVDVHDTAGIRRYLEDTSSSGWASSFEQLERGQYLSVVPGLQYIAANFTDEICRAKGETFCDEVDTIRITLGWLRQLVGLEHGLPPELAERIEEFSPVKNPFEK